MEMSEKSKKEVTSTEEVTETRKIQNEIFKILEKNEVTYEKAELILSGLANAMKKMAVKQKLKKFF